MKLSLSRRELLAAGAPATFRTAAVGGPPTTDAGGIKIGFMISDLSDATLRFVKQIGVDWVGAPARYTLESAPRGLMPPLGRPPGGSGRPWVEAEIRRVKERIESAGLRVGIMSVPNIPNVILGRLERDRDIDNVRESIRVAGRLGIPVVQYSFEVLRASEGYYRVEGRAGAGLRAFDYDRIKDKPRLQELGEPNADVLWQRLSYFVKAVVPAAEGAGVRLAVHPDDPPVPKFRGVVQILGNMEGLKRLIEIVPSKANGIVLDTGVTKEMGSDVVETIRYFGSRDSINHVHFRNVRVAVPSRKYTETFIDDGEVDMLAAMKAFHEVGYSQMMIPDHTPELSGDTERQQAGWAFAVGHMKALLRASE
jgi:mannonate dehydratase